MVIKKIIAFPLVFCPICITFAHNMLTKTTNMKDISFTSIKRVGGANLRFISHILSLLLLSSLALQQVTADSVHRFQLKVSDFAVAYPEVTSEQLYHQIRQNIYDAYLVIGIEPGAWGEDKEIEFTFGKY